MSYDSLIQQHLTKINTFIYNILFFTSIKFKYVRNILNDS